MNLPINASNDINVADLAWLILAIRAAVADTDDVTTALVSARLAALLTNQMANQAEQKINTQLIQLQQLNIVQKKIVQKNNEYWQLNPTFLQQLSSSTNCGCGYQAQWALTKSLLEQWI